MQYLCCGKHAEIRAFVGTVSQDDVFTHLKCCIIMNILHL